jgi:hypothetical protein
MERTSILMIAGKTVTTGRGGGEGTSVVGDVVGMVKVGIVLVDRGGEEGGAEDKGAVGVAGGGGVAGRGEAVWVVEGKLWVVAGKVVV